MPWSRCSTSAVLNGAAQYPITDVQNTVWAVADPQGQALATYDYTAFGSPLSQSGSLAGSWLFTYAGKPYDSTTGLYDFGARLYDPSVMRFLGADPARQYASPYVFASNNPLNNMDPSGNISLWAQIGIGIAMAAVAIAGLVLSTVTFGAAAAPTAAAETGLAGGLAAGEAGAIAADAVGTTLAEGAGAGATGLSEVAAGAGTTVEAAAPLTTAQMVGQNALSVLQSAVSGAVTSAGTSGLQYDIQHGRDFTAAGFFKAVGIGALQGFAGGGIGGLATMPATLGLAAGKGVAQTVLFRVLAKATAGMVGKDVSTLLTDAVTGQKVTVGQLLQSSAQGFAMGALTGSFGAIKGIKPDSVAVTATDKALMKASTVINKTIDNVKTAAQTQNAIATYLVGGYFLVSSYAAWGAYDLSKKSG